MIQLILHSPLSQTPTKKPTGILNDSALAAVGLPNGDRRVFFQENSGNIRQAVYQGSRNQWSASLTDIIVSDAKMHTPLAAIALNKTDEIVVDIFHGVYLVYERDSNSFCRFNCSTLPPLTLFPMLLGLALKGGNMAVSSSRYSIKL